MKREALIFLVVGSLTVLIDFLIYHSGLALGAPVAIAKGIGFAAGTIFAFFANKFWTFSARDNAGAQVWKFLLLYGATLALNIGINTLALAYLAGVSDAVQLAFLLATGCSAVTNFIGMKWLVFRPSRTIWLEDRP